MSDNIYSQHWDYYAAKTKRSGDWWPGDEWGTKDSWERVFKKLFIEQGTSDWRTCVEIGPGSGKYTIQVLRSSQAHVMAADVSAGYQQHFRDHLTEEGLIDRVTPVLLDSDSGTLYRSISQKGWRGNVDAFYSIDAMVHVDLQYLIAYLVTAAVCLKKGGRLVLTLANCCSDGGFAKLIVDTKRIFSRIGTHSAKFEWLSPDAVRSILPRLGFGIDMMDTSGRDILVTATLLEQLSDPRILAAIE